MVAPTRQVSRQIAQFLRANGATKVQNRGDNIKMTAPVSVIEKLLQTTLYNFHHVESMHYNPSVYFPFPFIYLFIYLMKILTFHTTTKLLLFFLESSRTIVRAVGSYEIPSDISMHVDFVSGLYEFPSVCTCYIFSPFNFLNKLF
jgi:hypothetical protein